MTIETQLHARADGKCELCSSDTDLSVLCVEGAEGVDAETALLTCAVCASQIDGHQELNVNHWRCLNDSAWSQVSAVQVVAWRMLNRLSDEAWARDILDVLYLDDETLAWAKAGMASGAAIADTDAIVHKDSNGAILSAGDTVTLIKDLKVKGAGFTAKRGTAVRNISLVHDNAAQIEGRVNNQRIVILTEFVKKS